MAERLIWLFVATLLIGTTVESVTIDPINPVVRAEETVRLMCRTNGSPIKKCQWEINGDLYELGEGQRFQPFGRLQDGECGIQATMSETENGPWTCHVFKEGSSRGEKTTTNVTQLVLPNITLRPNSEPITVMAGQETEVSCKVENARPAPGILWKIGDREIDSINRQSKSTPLRDPTQITITDTLKYTFEAVDHNQVIRCLTVGPWLTENDPHEATAHLNVIFPPQPKEPTTLYGYVAGQAGDVVVNFTANPSPIRVYWKVEDDTQLNVVPYDGPSTNDRFEVYELRTTDLSAFEAKLRVRSVSESDARRNFRLFVESDLNGEQHVQEYIVRISMSAAPLQSGGVSGGGIAGIIIAVLAILVILAALLYARNTGQWCFAGGRRTVGEGESRARIDEENPGDIVKEKEGKEGPLKGSTENLNLALATDGTNLENGNNGNLPPSPTKEQQQNGGSVSPSQDGTKAVGTSTKDSADEEAGVTGEETELTASAPAAGAAKGDAPSNPRPSLTNRLSSLYESLLSKAAPKKLNSERVSGGVGNNAADIDATKEGIVYAELDLKAAEETVATDATAAVRKEETTEYAEIVAVTSQDKSPSSPAKPAPEKAE